MRKFDQIASRQLLAGISPKSQGRNARSIQKLLMIALMGLILSVSSPKSIFAFAQEDDDDEVAKPVIKNPVKKAPPKQNYNKDNIDSDLIRSADEVADLPKNIDIGVQIQDFDPDLATDRNTPLLKIRSIEPARGPTTGDTRVLVRGGPFGKWQYKYPRPLVSYNLNPGFTDFSNSLV